MIWVQLACGLKPQYASKLIKAAEWLNVAHVQHLDGCTDVATLFILSADTTTEEVREWFMERCEAGDPPSKLHTGATIDRGHADGVAPPFITMKITPQQFQRETGCTDGERRLVANSPLSGRGSDGRIDGTRARQVLSGIRLARAQVRLEAIYDGCADL